MSVGNMSAGKTSPAAAINAIRSGRTRVRRGAQVANRSHVQRWIPTAILAVTFLGLPGCRRGDPQQQPTTGVAEAPLANTSQAWQVAFAEITSDVKLAATYRNGEGSDNFSLVESLGGGVAVLDFDLDGRPDLYFPGGGQITANQPLAGLPGSLWQSRPDGTFRDVTEPAGVDLADLYTHGVAVADIDADGFPDLLVTGYGGVRLFRNCGDGTFVEQSAQLGIESPHWSSSAAFGDFDGDGLVDLYLVHYVDWSWENHPRCSGRPHGRDVCTPQHFDGLTDRIFWNQGDGTFQAADESAGLVEGGKGLGVIALDVNHDATLDIYVANDTTNNFLYLNQGERRFVESGVVCGTALDHFGIPNGSMGLATFDYDGDQLPDLFVTNFENETFAVYRNAPGANFRSVSERSGITALGTLLVGFGVVSGDFNLNGLEDLVISNGHVLRYPPNDNLRQPPLYIGNDGQGRLSRLAFPDNSYFASKQLGRGVVAVDLSGNGRLDLVFTHTNQPAAILENRSPSTQRHAERDDYTPAALENRPPSTGGWIGLRLIGRKDNRDAIGARATLTTDSTDMLRHVYGGGSYLSQGPYTLHWGIPPGDEPRRLEITWPDGRQQQIADPEPGKLLTVVQPHDPQTRHDDAALKTKR